MNVSFITKQERMLIKLTHFIIFRAFILTPTQMNEMNLIYFFSLHSLTHLLTSQLHSRQIVSNCVFYFLFLLLFLFSFISFSSLFRIKKIQQTDSLKLVTFINCVNFLMCDGLFKLFFNS